MHAPGCPTLSTVALAARNPRVRATCATVTAGKYVTTAHAHSHRQQPSRSARSFHSTPPARSSPPNPPNGGKPETDSTKESSSEPESSHEAGQAASEATGGRARRLDAASLKARQARRQDSTHLPPVALPTYWKQNNVTRHSSQATPVLPAALALEAKEDKVSRIHSGSNTKPTSGIVDYFSAAVNELARMQGALVSEILQSPNLSPFPTSEHFPTSDNLTRLLRLGNMFMDAAWNLTDAYTPGRNAEYTYKTRPFWWWHFFKDTDPITYKYRGRGDEWKILMGIQLAHAEFLRQPFAHALADFPIESYDIIRQAVRRDLVTPAPASFDPKTGQRPIQVVALSGYSGKAIAESLGRHIGWMCDAEIVHVDAQDLSVIIGEYLGQTWAYSRGSVSTMGFRAAEANGKIDSDADNLPKQDDDDGSDGTSIISVRASSSSLEDELEKIRQGNFDTFSKWDRLKIDKVLNSIINAADRQSDGNDASSRTLVHVHDYVELNMTIEGSYILSRLRALVDAAWKRGKKVSILATSSSSQPSDEYQSTIREMAATDFVVSRHIQPDRAAAQTSPNPSEHGKRPPFSLEKLDTFIENSANINRMLYAMGSTSTKTLWQPLNEYYSYIANLDRPSNMLRQSVLPLPEIYQLAGAFQDANWMKPGSGAFDFLRRFRMGPLRQPPGQDFPDDKQSGNINGKGDSSKKSSSDSKSGSVGGLSFAGLNEYEKRMASGFISREKVRTTFADVHAPAETISALKLLTSLALIRPDAFSYGVLAHDKITGCLLYGPPGTGKTMLAKAVAHESGANMLEISGASINDKWVGETEKLTRAVFTLAKKLSPCVIFIDEADALLANRSSMSQRNSHRDQINQFLKEWDGVEGTSAFVMVATNRPFDLDDAVLRRLPRKILVDLPTQADRAAILRLLLRGEKLEEDVSVEEYAQRTPYYSGSDLKSVCVAAAMAAVEEENHAANAYNDANAGKEQEPYKYPERRVLRREHFERAMKQIPASISEDMLSLRLIRKFDEEYGTSRKGAKKKGMGFGTVAAEKLASAEGRVRQGGL